MYMEDKIEKCYKESIQLLKKNSNKFGILASAKSTKAASRNYLSIFGRDASICVIGMCVSGDKSLQKSALLSLSNLAKYQADNGQIPFWVKPEKKQADFYYLGCIDATLWWLIAIKFYDKNTGQKLEKKFSKQIALAWSWLRAQEHPQFYLLRQNQASDWADIMPRSGFVLYSNALWYWAKKLYNKKDAKQTKEFFNFVFDTNLDIPKQIINKYPRLETLKSFINKKNKDSLYLSFVDYSVIGYEGDVLGNILACLLGLADDKKIKKIIDFFIKQKANQPGPIKAVLKPILKSDKLWRPYMDRHGLNKPGYYHNGGIWPFIGGFWVMLLSMYKENLAQEELANLAKINSLGNWQFKEWLSAKDAKIYGMSKQSWNAALYIWAYNNIKK